MDLTQTQLDNIYNAACDAINAAYPVMQGGQAIDKARANLTADNRVAIDEAARTGASAEQIAAVIGSMIHRSGWTEASGEYFPASLHDAFPGQPGEPGDPNAAPAVARRTPAQIKADASNGANIAQAEAGHAFTGVDGETVRPEIGKDAFDAAVALLIKTYPYTVPTPPAPVPWGKRVVAAVKGIFKPNTAGPGVWK